MRDTVEFLKRNGFYLYKPTPNYKNKYQWCRMVNGKEMVWQLGKTDDTFTVGGIRSFWKEAYNEDLIYDKQVPVSDELTSFKSGNYTFTKYEKEINATTPPKVDEVIFIYNPKKRSLLRRFLNKLKCAQ